MKVIDYVFFENPGEKSKIKKIAKESKDSQDFILKIQDEFHLDIVEANRIKNCMYNKLRDE